MSETVTFPGQVEWSGENPCISLKEKVDGPFTALASFFRVILSPHGRGQVLLVLQSPQDENPPSDRGNFCIHNNYALAQYLIDGFASHFVPFRNQPGLRNLTYLELENVESSGDPASSYSETITAKDLVVKLTWSGLGEPFCFALAPQHSATEKHSMPSLFVSSSDPRIEVNGRRLPGAPVPRQIAGRTITTAMLAFSETWIKSGISS